MTEQKMNAKKPFGECALKQFCANTLFVSFEL